MILLPGNYGVRQNEVRKCENYEDLKKNTAALSQLMNECTSIPDWIKTSILENFTKKMADKPTELQDMYGELQKALSDYKENIEEMQTNIDMEIMFTIRTIKGDTDIKELLSKNYKNEDLTKYCPLIDAIQNDVKEFNSNTYKSIEAFRAHVAPKIQEIINRTIDLTKNYDNGGTTDSENAKKELKSVINLIEEQYDFGDDNWDAAITEFRKQFESSAAQFWSTIVDKIKDKN